MIYLLHLLLTLLFNHIIYISCKSLKGGGTHSGCWGCGAHLHVLLVSQGAGAEGETRMRRKTPAPLHAPVGQGRPHPGYSLWFLFWPGVPSSSLALFQRGFEANHVRWDYYPIFQLRKLRFRDFK